MTYFDGYLIPVRADNLDEYARFSTRIAAIYREYGAVRVIEGVLDPGTTDGSQFHAHDARAHLHDVALRDFHAAAATREGEVVVLSWIEWPDKNTRDEMLPRVLADPRIQPEAGQKAVFEGTRLIAGGFQKLVDV